ncbi:MAG: gliding motility-associated C-terminal domain-containing protein [Saprospiraceae bacterium]|nr:gliding motility-associated C-terminal domain-containing protein [Saprospiraceae bacterium]
MTFLAIWVSCLLFFHHPPANMQIRMDEICDNAIDDDGDGLIDLNDPDCICNGIRDTFFVPSGLIPNPSFEDYYSCPDTTAQLYKCQNWIQASNATSDYFNICDFWKDPVRGQPPLPLPAGDGFVGFLDIQNLGFGPYKEYVGACLTSPMMPGKEYTLKFWIGFGRRGEREFMGGYVGPRFLFNMAIFGNSNCSNLPFGNGQPNPYLCPTAYANSGWFEMTRLGISGANRWIRNTVKLRPNVPVETIVLGPACTVTDGNYFYWLDELILEETTRFDSFQFAIKGLPCQDTVKLEGQKSNISTIKYQWYKDGIAIIGATSHDYIIPTDQEGLYQLRASDGTDCELSNAFLYQLDHSFHFIDTVLCEGDYLEVEGTKIDKEGLYTFVKKKKTGCDSTIYIDLKLAQPKSFLIDTAVCRNTTIQINGTDFPNPGIFQQILRSQEGCDSVLDIRIKHIDFIQNNIDTGLCLGDYFIVGRDTLTQNGKYDYWYVSANGCDSLVSISLQFLRTDFVIDYHRICEGDSIQFGNQFYFKSGQFDEWNMNQFGCDSLSRLVLQVNKLDFVSFDTLICDGDYLIIDQVRFDKEGLYKIYLKNSNGCDSIIDLNLRINPSEYHRANALICEGTVLEIWGKSFQSAGTYLFSEKNALGCDEFYELELKTIPAYIEQLDTTICEQNSFHFRGTDYNMSGDYEVKVPSPLGCDSIFRLSLSIAPVTTQLIDTTICYGESIRINGQMIDKAGNYLFTEKSINNCDSIIELKLRIAPMLEAEALVRPIKCFGQSDAQIQLRLFGAYPPFEVSWSNGSKELLLDSLAPGVYDVFIRDQLGCITRRGFEILEPECFCFEFDKEDLYCFQDKGSLKIRHQSGGKPPFRYLLNGQSVEPENLVLDNLIPGDYELLILDDQACPVEYDFQIERKGNVTLDLGLDTVFMFVGDTANLNFGGVNLISDKLKIQWSQKDESQCDTCYKFQIVARDGLQYLTSIGIDEYGCEYQYQAIVIGKSGYWVPNVFTPNGDGVNDYFNLFTDLGFDHIDKMQIFDRWGGLIFESRSGKPNGPDGAWFGESKGRPVNPGVYTYLIFFNDRLGKQYKIAGDVTLIR